MEKICKMMTSHFRTLLGDVEFSRSVLNLRDDWISRLKVFPNLPKKQFQINARINQSTS